MIMKFYISDLHIGHANVLQFDNRPFFTLDEMHQAIINNWNSAVGKGDDVYILGDFAWKNDDGLEVIKQLNGKKFLIKGNHDRLSPELEKQFVWVKDYDVIKDDDRHVVLFHYPIAHWRNSDYGYYHLYGHIHQGRDARPFQNYVRAMKFRDLPYECYNVGCMMDYMNYTPRTLDEIIAANKENTNE
jgi:Predicted phosphoesterase or phosphohydrolase